MWKIQIVNYWNLQDFSPPVLRNQNTKFLLCNGLLRLGKHHKFASTIVGVGTIGLVLAYKYGSLTSSLGSKWLDILMSTRAADNIHCSSFEELTVPGLRNMGNNCFLNVILQALASSYFFQSFIDSCVQISEKSMEENAEFMPLAAAISILLEELSVLGAEGRVVSPRQVMMALEAHAVNFDLARQQDAAEALGHLLSALKEECLQYMEQYMPHHGSLSSVLALCDSEFTNHKDRGERISLEIWNHYLKRPLDGTIGSVLTCESCSFQPSTHFEFFHDLPVAPIVDSDGDIVEGCTLDNCLKKFTAPEQIRNYRCNNCSHLSAMRALSLRSEVNKAIVQKIEDCSDDESCSCEALVAKEGLSWSAAYRNACKQLRLGCCPKVLCIHLQRASINEIGELIKLRGHVSFPIVLNLFPYTVAAQGTKRVSLLHERQMQTMQNQSMLSHIEQFKVQFDRNLSSWSPLFAKEVSFYSNSMSENCVENTLRNTVDQLLQPQVNKPLNDEKINNLLHRSIFQCEDSNSLFHGSKSMSSSRDTDGNSSYRGSHSKMQYSSNSHLQPIKDQNGNAITDDLDNARCVGSQESLPYGLISVVQHHGNLGSGHYTVYRKVKVSKHLAEASALCMTTETDHAEKATYMDEKENRNLKECEFARIGNKNMANSDVIWFRISDSRVERVTEKCVLGAYASLLFYERLEDDELLSASVANS